MWRVHSGRLPGYVSDHLVDTLARYLTSFCKIWYCGWSEPSVLAGESVLPVWFSSFFLS